MASRMRLDYVEMPGWAELTWLAECSARSDVVTVFHGPGVETWPEWFCEAAWPGRFEDGGFDRTETVAGSGGRLRDGALTFVPASSTVDRLQYLQVGDDRFVSNSLPALLSTTGARLRPSYPRYNRLFSSIMFGLQRYDRLVESSAGPVELVYYDHLRWDGRRLERVTRPDDGPAFTRYDVYAGHLRETLMALAANGRAAGRRHPFELLTTASSGYDSTATSTLAKQAGCRDVICIDKGQEDVDDTGRGVAGHLGLNVIAISRDAWRDFDDVEVRTAAGGYLGSVVLAGAEPALRHRILLTGFHGDKIWAYEGGNPSPSIVRGDCSGLGLTEYRLWAGCLSLPLPFCGARRAAEIIKISQSEEMRPYLIPGTTYNRPVPRRIAEEAGVPREAFGVRKVAADLMAWQESEFLSPPAMADYKSWLKDNRSAWYRHLQLPPLRSAAGDEFLNRLNVMAMHGVNRIAIAGRNLGTRVPPLRRVPWGGYVAMAPKLINLRQYYVPWAIERVTAMYSRPAESAVTSDSATQPVPPPRETSTFAS